MFDPLGGAEKDENGTIVYRLEDKEISSNINDDVKLRKEFEKLKEINENVLEVSEDDADELRIKMMEEMEELTPFS